MEEELKRVECLIERCNQCKLNACISCEISWTEISSVRRIIDRYKELEEENKQLKEKWERDCHKIHEIVREEHKIKTNYIPTSVIKNKLEQRKAKTDCRYCNNACDSYSVCRVLQELLKEGNG